MQTVRQWGRDLGAASLSKMDGWPADFPLLPTDRAHPPDLDIDSLLDFASQSLLQPVFEQPGALKTPPLSFQVCVFLKASNVCNDGAAGALVPALHSVYY